MDILQIFLALFFTAIAASLMVFYISGAYSSVKGAPFVPTSRKRITDILKKGKLKNGQVFLELGCGDGRVVHEAVKQYKVRGIGVDINPLLLGFASLLARQQGIKVSFLKQSVYEVTLEKADVIFLFLMPKMLQKLAPTLEKAIKRGTLVISHGFRIPLLANYQSDVLPDTPFPTYYYRRKT